LVSVEVLEEKTGIDFFEKQPKTWQDAHERMMSTAGWDF
jgi:endonuclease G